MEKKSGLQEKRRFPRKPRQGFPSPGGLPPLTTTQKEIFHLLVVERLTPKQAAIRRNTTPQAVWKTRRELIKLGYLRRDYTVPEEVSQIEIGSHQETFSLKGRSKKRASVSGGDWRLHGCAWRCPIIEGKNGRRYREAVGSGRARVRIGSATVELCRKVVEVHTDVQFRSDSPEGAVLKSWEYLFRILARVENDYRVILRKDRHPIRRFRGHFPRENDEVARAGGSEVRVYADDGKLRFIVDWSPGSVPEAEFLHAAYGEGDAKRYASFVKDVAEHPEDPLPSETYRILHDLAFFTKENAAAVAVIARVLRPGQKPRDSRVDVGRPFYVG